MDGAMKRMICYVIIFIRKEGFTPRRASNEIQYCLFQWKRDWVQFSELLLPLFAGDHFSAW